MSLKSKLITTISMFVLVLVMTIVGVFAVTSATVNMGGNITFVADDVYARITGKIEGANEPTNLAVLNYTATSEPSAEDLSTWINDLTFKSATESIKITVTVENLAQDRWLLVNVEDKITSPIENLIRKMEKGGQAYTSGTNHALAPSTGEGTSKVEFVLTLSVENGNYSITDASYDYIIHLNNSNEEPEQPAEELEFTFDGNKVTGYTGTETNIRIPSSYSIQETEATEFIVTLDDFNGNTPEGMNKVGILMALSGYTLHLSNGKEIKCNDGWFNTIQDNIDEIQRNLPMTVDLTGVDLTFTFGENGLTPGQEQALGGLLQGYWYKQATDSDWVDSSVTPLPETLNYPVTIKVNNKINKYFEGNDYTVDTISMFSLPQSVTDTIVLTIPSTITNIDPYAFLSNATPFSLVFEDRTELPVIGENAFANSGLKSVLLPNTITGFVENVFDNCSNLEFNTYDNAYYLGNETNPYLVLYKAINTSVSSVQIHESCNIIADRAFEYSNDLSSITFEGNSQLKTIGVRAFRQCYALASISIPKGVTVIGESAFNNSDLTSIIIPEGVTSIGEHTFSSCKLTSVTIPESVKTIGDYAFAYNSSLTSITIPEGVTSIGNGAFSACSGLTEIIFNGNSQLQTIGESAFSSCSGLVSITLPEGVTEIGNDAFKYCTSLTSLTINAIEPPTLGNSVFHSNLATIYVPSGSVEKYQTAWADYSSKIQAIPEP